jgi:hypothetical protein
LLTLRKECRLRVFENRELRRIFGPKRAEVMEHQRRLHNKELYVCSVLLTEYYFGDKIKKTR